MIKAGEVTGKLLDNGMFRAPSLRNIDLTPPYMHDGRFKTLSEVIDHYNPGGFPADNKNPFIRKLGPPLLRRQICWLFAHLD